MNSLPRLACLLLTALLCAACKQPPLQGSFRCPDQVKFHYSRQSQTVELTRAGTTYQGIMDEKRQLTWPKNENDRSLPDTFALSRKDPKQLSLYGGFAGKGLACQSDGG
ncbi:hypothetical protein QU481_22970 [Crenobacter sp. SG2303]|uniref:C-type lysozyme inhibitor domain-containing protein n=1 Tax=Crenobacter oryzisoli TaxID=3056844 RepID=A0ABT7XV83_9NEIS|nr:hypothetical protein [Crenobacter sp. SG2303]MDN0077683.1 hypothetical protein [Crenobacter sp. SG2303]